MLNQEQSGQPTKTQTHLSRLTTNESNVILDYTR